MRRVHEPQARTSGGRGEWASPNATRRKRGRGNTLTQPHKPGTRAYEERYYNERERGRKAERHERDQRHCVRRQQRGALAERALEWDGERRGHRHELDRCARTRRDTRIPQKCEAKALRKTRRGHDATTPCAPESSTLKAP